MCACKKAHRQIDAEMDFGTAIKINHMCMQRQRTDRQTEMHSDMNSV